MSEAHPDELDLDEEIAKRAKRVPSWLRSIQRALREKQMPRDRRRGKRRGTGTGAPIELEPGQACVVYIDHSAGCESHVHGTEFGLCCTCSPEVRVRAKHMHDGPIGGGR